MDESLTDKIFAAWDFLVLERLDVGSFRVAGAIPDWVKVCFPHLTDGDTVLIPEEQFLFLDNFLIDAEEFWLNNRQKRLKSGIWTETYVPGNECYFEASAMCINNQNLLLIELLNPEVEEKYQIIQKARENNLNYQNVIKEIQKKEVLLHCILHDLAGQLASINCCFALLELENLTEKGKEQLEIGKKQSQKQEMLIRDILEAFSAEVNALKNFTVEPALAPNALTCARDVVAGLLPTFSLCQIGLQLADNIDATADWKVVGESSRLERIISNLIENALRYTPPDSTVTVNLQQDGEYILFTVNDEGTGVEPEVAQNLFKQFSQGKTNSGRAGLGLYFCRITVERWGGSIGYLPRPEGGSQFWFRLLKAANPC
jgi:signal transduction histidine kinase